MISKEEVLAYNAREAQMIRYIDSELLKYTDKIIEFSVDYYPQDLLDKAILVYRTLGWDIKQKNRRSNGYREGTGTKRVWRVG